MNFFFWQISNIILFFISIRTNASKLDISTCPLVLHSNLRVDGNDLTPKPLNTTSVDMCCEACTNTTKCRWFVYVKSRSICWLKSSGAGPRHNDSDCIAGEKNTPFQCTSSEDCNMAGVCNLTSHMCQCDIGWTGKDCSLIKFGHSYMCGKGGLCLNDTHITPNLSSNATVTSTWGGEAIPDDQNPPHWHLYAAGFSHNLNLGSWLTDSIVVHASSPNPFGPYTAIDVALGPRGNSSHQYWDSLTEHNPAVQRAPDGTYLLYYMGSSRTSNIIHENFDCNSKPTSQPVCMQRVGLAVATSPNGPWKRRNFPILGVGPHGEWDDLFTTNPTPHVFQNGSVLLIYKAHSIENPGAMLTGVAYASNWTGPYVRSSPSKPIDLPTNCEDAGIYYSKNMNVFRMILHCGCNYQYVWSVDGINWKRTTSAQPYCNVSYASGGFEKLKRRERPKWLIGVDGNPKGILNGVMGPISHDGKSFTMVTQILP